MQRADRGVGAGLGRPHRPAVAGRRGARAARGPPGVRPGLLPVPRQHRAPTGAVNPAYDQTRSCSPTTSRPSGPDTSDAGSSRRACSAPRATRGTCRVVCFSPRHDLTLAGMADRRDPPDRRRLGGADDRARRAVPRGSRCSRTAARRWARRNPHPHGQIWAGRRAARRGRARGRAAGAPPRGDRAAGCCVDYAAAGARRPAGRRATPTAGCVVVPFWAAWPFETLLVPLPPAARLADLDDAARDGLAAALRDLDPSLRRAVRAAVPVLDGLAPGAVRRRPRPTEALAGPRALLPAAAARERPQVHGRLRAARRAPARPHARGGRRAAPRDGARRTGTAARRYDGAAPERRAHAAVGRPVRRRAGRADGGLHAVDRRRRRARARRHRGLDRPRARPRPRGPADRRRGRRPRGRARRAARWTSRPARSPGTRPSRTSTSTSRRCSPSGSGPVGGKLHTGPLAQRPGRDGPAAVVAARGRPPRRRDRRARARARRPGRARRRRRPARARPTSSRPSRCCSPTTCSPTSRCSSATAAGSPTRARRLNVSPLGAGALAGAGYPLDRETTAAELGFDGVTANSLDAVADRDFVVELLAAAALAMVHLSRLAEEVTWWSNPRFGFVRVADAFSTGSSMMPNKKNPDPAELVRGRTAARDRRGSPRCSTLLKGLPLAYQRDLQEDKPALFAAVGDARGLARGHGRARRDARRRRACGCARRPRRATRPRPRSPTPSSGAACRSARPTTSSAGSSAARRRSGSRRSRRSPTRRIRAALDG